MRIFRFIKINKRITTALRICIQFVVVMIRSAPLFQIQIVIQIKKHNIPKTKTYVHILNFSVPSHIRFSF